MTCHVEVWHVHGLAYLSRVGTVCEFNMPTEASTREDALRKATGWLAKQRAIPMQLDAHRCAVFEQQIDDLVRGIFADVEAQRKGVSE